MDKYTGKEKINTIDQIHLKTKIYEIAKHYSVDFDVYFLGQEWRMMLNDKKYSRKTDSSFINFVKWYTKKTVVIQKIKTKANC